MSTSLRRILCFVLLAACLMGCGEGGPSPKVEADRLEHNRSLRAFFDRAHGNYDQLSAKDQAEFVKLNDGDSAKAQKTWNLMKYGPAAMKGNSK